MNQRTKSGIRFLIVVSFICATAAAMLEFYNKSNSVEWVSYSDAIQHAKATKKMLYVDFYADWCQPCKQMDKTTFASDTVISLLKNDFIATRINVDEPSFGQPMTKRYNINAMPTSMVMTADEQEVRRNVGYMNTEDFIVWLKEKK